MHPIHRFFYQLGLTLGLITPLRTLRAQRNEPCPCGSKSKYKNCHIREDEEKVSLALEAKAAGGRLVGQLKGRI